MKNYLSFRFTFKAVDQNQRALVLEWIGQEHIKKWLHGEGLKNTQIGLDHFLKGKPCDFKHWLAYDQHVPFAYLLTSDIKKNSFPEDELAQWCQETGDAITLDLFICDLNYMGKGLAVPLIHEFLFSQFSHVSEVFIDPEIANSRAVHVYKKAGFQIVGEFIAPWHPVPHYRMRLSMKELYRVQSS